jgi:hypothetical protein
MLADRITGAKTTSSCRFVPFTEHLVALRDAVAEIDPIAELNDCD